MGSSVVVCIPAFNEELNIKKVVVACSGYGDVIVFDNNSNDKTANIAEKFGATIMTVPDQGYDQVIESIGKFFIQSKYTKLVIVDGDGEVGLDCILESINMLDNYDAVIGCRASIDRFGERIVCKLFKYFYGVEDIYCGFKCFTKLGVNRKYVKKSYGTSIFKKGATIFNQAVSINARKDQSKLGNGIYLNYQLFIGGVRGLFL